MKIAEKSDDFFLVQTLLFIRYKDKIASLMASTKILRPFLWTLSGFIIDFSLLIMAEKYHCIFNFLFFLVYCWKTMDIRKFSERYEIPNHDFILQLDWGKCTNCRYHAIRKYFLFWITHPTKVASWLHYPKENVVYNK